MRQILVPFRHKAARESCTRLSLWHLFVLAMLFASMFLNYFDRQTLSLLKPLIERDFKLTDDGYANIVSGFLVTYVIAYPVGGFLVARIGVRKAMSLFISVWSAANILTSCSWRFGQLFACRMLLGAAEPGGYPAALTVVVESFPAESRGTISGIYQAGSAVAAVLAFPIVAYITARWKWRTAFAFPGVLGLCLAGLWWLVYRRSPAPIPQRDAGIIKELRSIRSGTAWSIILARALTDQVWYFCMFWMPGYIQESFHLTLAQTGMFGWVPFFCANFGGVTSSLFSDVFVRKGHPPSYGRLIILIGSACFAPLAIAIPWIHNEIAVIILFSVLATVCQIWLFNLTTLVADCVPGSEVASVLGLSGSFGALGGLLSSKVIGMILGVSGYKSVFTWISLLHLAGAFILLKMRKSHRGIPSEQKVYAR